MKRFIALFFVCTLLLSFTACAKPINSIKPEISSEGSVSSEEISNSSDQLIQDMDNSRSETFETSEPVDNENFEEIDNISEQVIQDMDNNRSETSEILQSPSNKNQEEIDNELNELIHQYLTYGILDGRLIQLLIVKTPNIYTFDPEEVSAKVSSVASLKPKTANLVGCYNFDGEEEEYNYLFNWEYPLKFKTERDEIFELMAEIDGLTLELDESLQIVNDVFVPMEKKGYGSFQMLPPNKKCNERTIYYYGELSGKKPNGKGVLLHFVNETSALVPTFAGYFENGVIKGYGMQLSYRGDGKDDFLNNMSLPAGIQIEGYFDFSVEDDVATDYSDLNGIGIVYYDYSSSYALYDLIQQYNYSEIDPVKGAQYTVITNYPVARPKVLYDGLFENGFLTAGSQYGLEDTCYGTISYVGSFDKGLNKGVCLHKDGKLAVGTFYGGVISGAPSYMEYATLIGGLYYPTGILEFVGIGHKKEYSEENEFVYEYGLYFDENGEFIGYYKNGEFEWLD